MKVVVFFLLIGFSLGVENIGTADDNVWPTFLKMIGIFGEFTPQEEECRVEYQHIYSFECDTEVSAGPPATSVHKLRPHDISVIGAMGDSLTAGFGADACTLNEVTNEYRGVSWPVGGDETIQEVLTLPNIIKEFNPQLRGYSTGVVGWSSEEAAFNTAITGARSEDMVLMTNELISRMKAHPEVNLEADWKVVSILIGPNDLCQYCFNFNKYSAEQYTENLREALDILHEQMPRTLVNLQGVLRVADVDHLSGLKCDAIHVLACNCVMFKEGTDHQELVDLMLKYQRLSEELVMSGRYDTRDDFTVVYQPFMTNTRFPLLPNLEGDSSYFAPDCFHFSSKGHATFAKELWNSMLIPVGQKPDVWNPSENIQCPTMEHPFIYTNMNSDLDPEQYPYYGSGAEMSGAHVTAVLSSLLLSVAANL